MKTVRLSQSLTYDIRRAAENKYDSANPKKEYAKDGMQLFIDEGYQQKIDVTSKQFKDVWGFDMPVNTVRYLVISSQYLDSTDDEGNEHYETKSYTLDLPNVEVPTVLVKYGDEMRVKVDPDNPTFLHCIETEMFNSNRDRKKREYVNNLDTVLHKFSTLNQLMKAAPYIKDLVPQDRLQKMHEVDDRSGRKKEQAEIADNELSELREVLLEDALLGDD
mgnify:CR=1 FL=1|tara:strand:+ start:3640 stop:4296 length:657 start_codon:yes stop_codon:yes gene_type:complete